jgi:hypothetical protein
MALNYHEVQVASRDPRTATGAAMRNKIFLAVIALLAPVFLLTCYAIGVQGSVAAGLQKMQALPAAASDIFGRAWQAHQRQSEWNSYARKVSDAIDRDLASSKWSPYERDERKEFFDGIRERKKGKHPEFIYQEILNEAKSQLIIDGFWP